jgi:hypothetical protein
MADALAVLSVREFSLELQGWAGLDTPDPARIGRPTRTEGPRSKPLNVFFTSSLDATGRSTSWMEWLHTQRSPRLETEKRWLFSLLPDPAARLYVIHDLDDYQRLADAYPHRWASPEVHNHATVHPNWYEIGRLEPQPFDAIHATQAAVEEGRGGPRFSGWDVESTWWLTWSFVDVHRIGPLDGDSEPQP